MSIMMAVSLQNMKHRDDRVDTLYNSMSIEVRHVTPIMKGPFKRHYRVGLLSRDF